MGLGRDSFAVDPPKRSISFVEPGRDAEDAIVVLKDPQIEGDSLTYTVDMLEGSLPPKGEFVSIFIDPFGRPLRRLRRRMHRRHGAATLRRSSTRPGSECR